MAARKFQLAAVLLALAVAGAQAQTATFPTVLAAVQATPELALLGAAATALGLGPALADPNLQAIVLAPVNGAVNATLGALGVSLAAPTPAQAALLTSVLRAHIIPRNTSFPTIVTNASSILGPSLLNSTATQEGDVTVIPTAGGNALLYGVANSPATTNLSVSVTAGRSRVYLLSGSVVIPVIKNQTSPYISVADAAVTLGSGTGAALSSLLALVRADSTVLAALSNADAALTVFAPTNAAFTGINITAIAGSAAARRILLNHVVGLRPFLAAQLPTGTTNVTSLSAGDFLTITRNGTSVTVRGAGNTAAARVVQADVIAGKSVIHVVDTVILPPSPPASPSPAPVASPPPRPAAAGMVSMSQLVLSSLAALALLAAFLSA